MNFKIDTSPPCTIGLFRDLDDLATWGRCADGCAVGCQISTLYLNVQGNNEKKHIRAPKVMNVDRPPPLILVRLTFANERSESGGRLIPSERRAYRLRQGSGPWRRYNTRSDGPKSTYSAGAASSRGAEHRPGGWGRCKAEQKALVLGRTSEVAIKKTASRKPSMSAD